MLRRITVLCPALVPRCARACAASLATLATYLKAAAPEAVAAALAGGVFQALLDLRRPLHLSPATAAYLQAFVAAQRNPVKARPGRPPGAPRLPAGGAFVRRAWLRPLWQQVVLVWVAAGHCAADHVRDKE